MLRAALQRTGQSSLLASCVLPACFHPQQCARLLSMSAEQGAAPAVIRAIQRETPRVLRFTLQPLAGRSALRFLPGQWVDFFVPGIAQAGGYSFTSTPRQLETAGTFELAVKRSGHPVATWLHTQARVGDRVSVRVGGTFHYLPGDERRPLLLVAGGTGINPLLSMLKHCCELREAGACSSARGGAPGSGCWVGGSRGCDNHGSGSGGDSGSSPEAQPDTGRHDGHPLAAAAAAGGRRAAPHAVVLYCAAVPAELAFRRELEQLAAQAGGTISLHLHVTAPEWRGRDREWGGRWGRIGRPQLQAALQWLAAQPAAVRGPRAASPAARQPAAAALQAHGSSSSSADGGALSSGGSSTDGVLSSGGSSGGVPPGLAALLCGPPGMEDAVLADLVALGVPRQQVRFEKWW